MAPMRHTLALLLSIAVLAGAARADERFTIAAYNVENAFDVFDDPYTLDHETDVKARWEWEAIASAIRRLDADVVAFSEVENEQVLRALVDGFLGDAGYRYVAALPGNTDRGITLGVISRVPVKRLASHRFRPLDMPAGMPARGFARDLLQVTLEPRPGLELDVFSVHFKSKHDEEGDPESLAWRTAEAREAREVLDEVRADSDSDLVAFVGDFNDMPGTPPIDALTAGGALVDVLSRELSGEARVTYLREPYRTPIDHILVTPELAERYVPGSATILHDPELTRGSDHAPIAASFDLSR